MTKAYSYTRISSKRQVDGYGIKRQTEKAQEYADANGLELDRELEDIGSGYHGKHVRFGELGGFLKLVEQGEVPIGSTLIVESLDRLSREDVLVAQAQFINILAAGITIVTLIDNQVYHRDRDYTQLIMSLTIMKRANDESVTKAKRSQDNIRRNKMEALEGKGRFNLSCRRWIEQIKIDGTRKDYRFELNSHAATIREIYELYDSGIGVHTIARMLNDHGRPILKDGANRHKKWKDPIITRILQDEAVIGTYEVEENVDGRMVPMGEPIRNYYPAAVDEDLFWRVQRRREQIAYKGSTGRKYTNLFARMTCCANCGHPLKIINSGGGIRSKLYMCNGRFVQGKSVCDTSPASFRYGILEKAVLDNVREFYLDADLSRNRSLHIDELQSMINDTETQIAECTKERLNYAVAVGSADDADDRAMFQKLSSEARKKVDAAKARLLQYKQKLREANEQVTELTDVVAMVAEERKMWETSTDDDEIKKSRARVSIALGQFITLIKVYFEHQIAIVEIAGGAKGYVFDRYGNLIDLLDMTDLPFEQFEAGMKVDGASANEIAQAKTAYTKITAAS